MDRRTVPGTRLILSSGQASADDPPSRDVGAAGSPYLTAPAVRPVT